MQIQFKWQTVYPWWLKPICDAIYANSTVLGDIYKNLDIFAFDIFCVVEE